MLLINKDGLHALSSTVVSPKTEPSPIQKDNQNQDIFDSEKSDEIIKNLGVNLDVIVDSINISASKIQLTYKNSQYEIYNVHSKNQDDFIFKKNKDFLEEISKDEAPFLKNGYNGKYINPDLLQNFIMALLKKPSGNDSPDFFLKMDDDFKLKINNFFTFSKITKENVEKTIPHLRINVDNIENLTELIQSKIILSNNFKKEMISRMKSISEIKFENSEYERVVDDFFYMLKNNNFKLNSEYITKIETKNLITAYNIKEGIIDVPIKPITRKDAELKMLQKFVLSNEINIEASAINYYIGGRTKTNVPIFFSSQALEQKETHSIIEFNKQISKIETDLKKTKKILPILEKNKDNPLYTYAYLKFLDKELNNVLYDKNLTIEEKKINTKKIEAYVKEISNSYVLNKNVDTILEKNNLSSLREAINILMLIEKGKFLSNYDIKLSKDEKNVVLKEHSPLNYRDIFIKGEKVMSLGVTKKLVKRNFNEQDNSIRIKTNYKLLNLVTYDFNYKEQSFQPTSFRSFPVKFNVEEELGNIISNISKINIDSKIIYKNESTGEEKKYDFDLQKNVNKFIRGIDSLLYKNNSLKKSKMGVFNALENAKETIKKSYFNNTELKAKIEALQSDIKNNEYLQVLKNLGDSKKMTYIQKNNHFLVHSNRLQINKHIKKTDGKVLNSYIDSKLNINRFSSQKAVNKAIIGAFAKIERKAEFLKLTDYLDNKIFANKIMNQLKLKEADKPKNERFFTNLTKEEEESHKKYLTLKSYIRKITSIINAKVTGNVNNIGYGVNRDVHNLISKLYYPIKEEQNDYTLNTTTLERYTKLLEVLNKSNDTFFLSIDKKIQNQIDILVSNSIKSNIIEYLTEEVTEQEAAKPKIEIKEQEAAKPKIEIKEQEAAKPKIEVKEQEAAKPKIEIKEQEAAKPKIEIKEQEAAKPKIEIKEQEAAKPKIEVKEQEAAKPKIEIKEQKIATSEVENIFSELDIEDLMMESDETDIDFGDLDIDIENMGLENITIDNYTNNMEIRIEEHTTHAKHYTPFDDFGV